MENEERTAPGPSTRVSDIVMAVATAIGATGIAVLIGLTGWIARGALGSGP